MFDGREYELQPLNTTYAPSGMPHRFANRSNARMRIFWEA